MNPESNAFLRAVFNRGESITLTPNPDNGTIESSDGRVYQIVDMRRVAGELPILPIQSKTPKSKSSAIVRWQTESARARERRVTHARVKRKLARELGISLD